MNLLLNVKVFDQVNTFFIEKKNWNLHYYRHLKAKKNRQFFELNLTILAELCDT